MSMKTIQVPMYVDGHSGLTLEEVYDGRRYTNAARRLMAAWRAMVALLPWKESTGDPDADPDADTNGPVAGGMW